MVRGASVTSAGSYSGGGDRKLESITSSALGSVISFGKDGNGNGTLPH
jgi:hypothetical protein